MSWFHKEEETTVALLTLMLEEHPEKKLIFTFKEGDSYLCVYFSASEETDDSEDDYFEIEYDVLEVIKDGPNWWPNSKSININYKHFPTLITLENGDVIYSQSDR